LLTKPPVNTAYATEPLSSDTGLRGSYDREASKYDERRYYSIEGRLFSEMEVAILRSWVKLSPGDRVLDLPAGTGRMSFALAHTGAVVVGADISANMLTAAAAKNEAQNRVHFAQASGVELPFADNTFDTVTSFKFFHLIPNDRKPAFIREMTRVLKPGKSLIVEFNSPFYGVVLAAFRYYFLKKHPGMMRMKCLFPDQIPVLFSGLEVRRCLGVKLPFAGALSAVIGRRATERLDAWVGRLPGLKYLSYAIMIEARKPALSEVA
jgi:demethylmenaquinone methyltransferase/2-methoxy-6-polyprenyl-1,4-benzoquinol methylase